MKIQEKEIFNFVFFPEILDKEKILFLSNTDLFQNELNLLRSIKEKYTENVPQFIIEKIRSKIVEVSNTGIIRLEKKKNPHQNKPNHFVLAADSQLKNIKQIETFVDENSLYLVKVIMEEKFTKIFLFTRDNEEYNNIKIIVEPSRENYTFENSSDPIVIPDNQRITGISIIIPN